MVSTVTALRRHACSPPLPNSSRPTAKRPPPGSRKDSPNEFATANSRWSWHGNSVFRRTWLHRAGSALRRSHFSALLQPTGDPLSLGHFMRFFLALLALALVMSDGALAQNRVRTET